MAILEIKQFNNDFLRKRAKQVREIDKKTKKLVVDMAQTMKENNGIGLAAPQVGVLKRIIVVQADLAGQRIFVLLNPKIIKKSRKKEKDQEGCLSFPGIFLEIKRSQTIEVKGLDINGEKVQLKTEGVLARIIQHEVDHLNGTLFFNRLDLFDKIKFKLKHFSIKF